MPGADIQCQQVQLVVIWHVLVSKQPSYLTDRSGPHEHSRHDTQAQIVLIANAEMQAISPIKDASALAASSSLQKPAQNAMRSALHSPIGRRPQAARVFSEQQCRSEQRTLHTSPVKLAPATSPQRPDASAKAASANRDLAGCHDLLASDAMPQGMSARCAQEPGAEASTAHIAAADRPCASLATEAATQQQAVKLTEEGSDPSQLKRQQALDIVTWQPKTPATKQQLLKSEASQVLFKVGKQLHEPSLVGAACIACA